MQSEEELLALEKGFWKASFAGDGDYYAEHLADEALLVFPDPTGVLEKPLCVEIIRGSGATEASWEISEPRCVWLGDDVGALTYRGSARRPGASPERDRRSSVYRLFDGKWQLVLHHVTPEPDGDG